MKKRIIITAVFAICLALCAAVWPQAEPAEETPAVPSLPVVTATKPGVPEIPVIVEVTMTEAEKVDTPQPEPMTTQAPMSSEVQAAPDPSATPLQELEPSPALPDTPPENMVYVPGFGWIENQGPNHVEYAEDMYENGNKIGSMG